ncbi:bifunctional phosphoribosyl-AMP cyclohydrolase/phosphoribosyl-ATP diphosphatase HisIE [uncultured Helicobacter sp.]|uniref:bifunctional phosphoribosyl-AMP cyclohydrolase/phosphoribosyl-ATP diphosphatase HisIE n=1 Tax=uncultured Helicobacter sp. TaxID=175537 RepID=UPI00374E9371
MNLSAQNTESNEANEPCTLDSAHCPIDWASSPLVPTIVQNIEDNSVLMLAYSNQESLRLSLESKLAHYFSRSKQRIWKKGEQSGHLQYIESIKLDCDNDALLFIVRQVGVACHTGAKSCFFKTLDSKADSNNVSSDPTPLIDTVRLYGIVDSLYHTIVEKRFGDPKTSYTASLYAKGVNTICKKIIEEAGELTFALKDGKMEEIIYECSDLVYHTLVGLGLYGISPDRIRQELQRREGVSGIEEKNSRQG